MSTAAGIRPYLTLAVSAILMHDGTLHPAAQFAWLGSTGACILLCALAAVDFIGDKIPMVDHLLHAVHFVSKPVAAALVAGGTVHFQDQNARDDAVRAWLMAASAANALGLHFVAVTVRGVSTSFTFGAVNPLVSLGEDVLCVLAIAVAIFAPILGAIVAVILTIASIRFARLGLQHARALRGRLHRFRIGFKNAREDTKRAWRSLQAAYKGFFS